jgi:sugar O-acyltransferase (sialic acid O-acetyltransferase NeuD family)
MKRLAYIGAGMLGKQAFEIAELQQKYNSVGFYDDFCEETKFEDLPILGKINKIADDFENGVFDELFIAIGYNHLGFKQELFEQFRSVPMANIIHPSAIIENSAELQGGNLLYAMAYVGPRCTMEPGSVLNIMSYLAHDITLGNCSFMSGGINVGGKTTIGERCFIGLSTAIIDEVSICNDVFLGAGTVVSKSIDSPGTYVGVPARKIK